MPSSFACRRAERNMSRSAAFSPYTERVIMKRALSAPPTENSRVLAGIPSARSRKGSASLLGSPTNTALACPQRRRVFSASGTP